jgi:heme exporter protein B
MRPVSAVATIRWLVWREATLGWRRRFDALGALFFFVMVVSLFPLSIGPETTILRSIGPGVVWVALLLACMLSTNRLFGDDYADGTLEQMLLMPHPVWVVVLGKVIAHGLLSAAPLLLSAPLLAMQFGLSLDAPVPLALSLALGAPIVLLLGSVAAALTLGLRGGGVLTALLVMPLYVPTLIFGTSAAHAALAGESASASLRLLGATLIVVLLFAPWVSAAALRISVE